MLEPGTLLELLHRDLPGRDGEGAADPLLDLLLHLPLRPAFPSGLRGRRSHQERRLRLRHDHHRLALAVDVPGGAGEPRISRLTPAARRRQVLADLFQLLVPMSRIVRPCPVDFLESVPLSPLPQQPVRRPMQARVGVFPVQLQHLGTSRSRSAAGSWSGPNSPRTSSKARRIDDFLLLVQPPHDGVRVGPARAEVVDQVAADAGDRGCACRSGQTAFGLAQPSRATAAFACRLARSPYPPPFSPRSSCFPTVSFSSAAAGPAFACTLGNSTANCFSSASMSRSASVSGRSAA